MKFLSPSLLLVVSLVGLTILCYSVEQGEGACQFVCQNGGSCVNDVCACMSPYTGVDCSIYDQGLNSGVLVSNQAVSGNAWNYYHITVPSGGGSLYWYVQQTSAQSDCDLYLKPGSYPTRTSYVAKENGVAPTFTLNVTNATQGIWYAGIFGYTDCGYSIRVTLGGSCPNACSGHGVCSAGVCACNAGFTGRDCSVQEITLVNGTWATGSVALQSWNYYLFQGTTTMDYLLIEMSHSTGMDADLFVLRNSDPSLFSWDYANLTTATVSTINITQVSNAVYHIGIYGYTAASYQLRATSHVPQTAADCPNQCSLHGTCVRGTCSCTTGFIGNECETMVRALTLGTTYSGYSGTNAWNYYHIQAFTANSLLIQTTQVLAPGANNTGDCDLYVRRNANPDRFNYDLMDISVSPTFNLTIPNPANDVWYIGLYGWRACQYNLRVSEISTCSCALGGHGSCNSGSNACVCQPGWAGPGCNIAIVTLQNGVAASGTVAMNNWAFFQITTTSTLFEVAIKETNSTGLLWLFVNQTPNFPTLTAYDDADQTPGISIHYSFMEYSTTQTYTYTIGVYGNLFIGSLTQTYPFQIVAWSPNP